MSPAELSDRAAARQSNPPYRLLWLTGTLAMLLALIAFMMWGLGGSGLLLDMITALCT